MLKHAAYLASIFSPPFLRRLLNDGPHELASALRIASFPFSTCQSIGDIYESVYRDLQKFYRCEYVYKNAITSKILVGRHSPSTASLLTEVSVGSSKADLVLFNGRSIVYEIKTELDNYRRLPFQVHDYQEVFDRVYVVGYEDKARELLSEVPGTIGILLLTRNYTLREERAPVDAPRGFNKGAAFDVLRQREFVSIVRKHYGAAPQVPNTRIYGACRRLFLELPTTVARKEFMRALKERQTWKGVAAYLSRLPAALRFHAVTGLVRAEDTFILSQAVDQAN